MSWHRLFSVIKNKTMKKLTPTITTLLLGITFISSALAQSPQTWEIARDIRDLTFEAQKELFSAERADDPTPHYEASAALVDDAKSLYLDNFQADIVQWAPDVDPIVVDALDLGLASAMEGDAASLASARGRLWTTLLHASYVGTMNAIEARDVEAAEEWLRLREYRESTRVNVVNDPASQAILAFAADEITTEGATSVIANDLRDSYFFRLRAALTDMESAAEKEFSTRTAEWAGAAYGYFSILEADMSGKIGAETTQELGTLFVEAEQAAVEGRFAEIPKITADLRNLLANYQPVELTPSDISERGNLLYLFTDLVYIEYQNGVRDGEITIAIEYQEAITFRDQAELVFEELRPTIAKKDPVGADRLSEILTESEEIMLALGDEERVKVLIEEALVIIENSLEVKLDSNDISASFTILDTLMANVLTSVEDGLYADAERTRLEAYAIFENGPEQRLVHRAPLMSRELEGLFWEGTGGEKGLATLLAEEAPVEDIEVSIERVNAKLDEAEEFLSAGMSKTVTIINSAIIILREGLEAVLIIAAILGYLRATDGPKKYSAWIYGGVLAAIVLSFFTWWAAQNLITITVANREIFEGVTSLIAVAVLFYVTNWLFHKVYVVDWMTFVKEQVNKALTTGSALALAGLGFTVVYREGFETVLFYQALLFDGEPSAVWIGFVAGSLVIFAVAYGILKMSKSIPLKPFFTVTGVLLLILAFNFTGAGFRELQEAGTVSATLLPWMPENLWLMNIFGIFPTMETTLAQVVFIVAVIVTFSYSRWREGRK